MKQRLRDAEELVQTQRGNTKGGVDHLALYFLVFEWYFLRLVTIHTDIPRQSCEHKMDIFCISFVWQRACRSIYIVALCLLLPGK